MNITDPFAQAIINSPAGNKPARAEIGGKIFLLQHWATVWNNGEMQLETAWTQADDMVQRCTIPLRITLRIRAKYWRHKLFGRTAPSRLIGR